MRLTHTSLCLVVAVIYAAASSALAQKPASSPVGPVPPAVVNAKSIFVSNSDSDRDLFPGIYSEGHELPYLFTGNDGRPYSEFYSALAATGDYQLVTDPSQADLVLELQLRAHQNPTNVVGPLAEFRLIVYGSQSHYVLWTITQAIEPAFLLKNRDKNFEEALPNLLNQFLAIAGKAPAPMH
jgi:hypothetical protein